MSPSAERRPTARSRPAARLGVLGLITLLGCLGSPTTATAAPSPVDPRGLGIGAAEYGITAPVLDIAETTSDLTGTARVEQLPKRVTVTLDATVLFAKDSAEIRSATTARLAEVVTDLRSRGPGRVRIVGYTDDLGSAAHGLDLSRRRAQAVASVLRRDLPVADYPTTVVGKGEADPAVPNTSEANRRINRRVVLTYQPR